jgi:hypothetical protein
MLTLVLAAAAAILSAAALWLSLRAAGHIKTVSQSHWELRYEFSRLRARVAKLDGGAAGAPDPEDPTAGPQA